MPFIPHTHDDIQSMLTAVGADSIETLFDEIPSDLKIQELPDIPPGLTEMALCRLMQTRASKDECSLNFIGAGAYEHHIPAAVWDIASRGEWMTAYTPYQAEASQGTLQLLYEYQTMMANLMGMEVSNASLYDGGSALAEAVLMAIRCRKSTAKPSRVLVPMTVHPLYRQVLKTLTEPQSIEIVELPYCQKTGVMRLEELKKFDSEPFDAIVIPQPNFFGNLESVESLTHWAQQKGSLVIGVVNPLAMALLKPPGEWGQGADIVCGEGQPFGIPLSSGGPYFGFLCCQQKHIRQLPGRLIGRTLDKDGKQGFTLTLQAREQHIRRSKATSNICTNQGLLVTAATIYMSLLGGEGLKKVALQSHLNMVRLRELLKPIPEIEILFQTPFFHEIVLKLSKKTVEIVIQKMAQKQIQAGFNLKPFYPELGECLLVCVTETKTEEDLKFFVNTLQSIIQETI